MHEFSGKVERFPGKMGWHFVAVPNAMIPSKRRQVRYGLIPVELRLGQTKWKSSLLPKGDQTYFVALKASVRKREQVNMGDTVTITFWYA
jgi:hypothetical protein